MRRAALMVRGVPCTSTPRGPSAAWPPGLALGCLRREPGGRRRLGASSTPLTPKAFEGCAAVPAGLLAAAGGVVEIAVEATVDSTWGKPPSGSYSPAGKAPQSHLARAYRGLCGRE